MGMPLEHIENNTSLNYLILKFMKNYIYTKDFKEKTCRPLNKNTKRITSVLLVLEQNSWALGHQRAEPLQASSKEIQNASRSKNGKSYVCRRQNSDFRLVKILRIILQQEE